MASNKQLPEELIVLLRQLVMQGQIRIAGMVLQSYFLRFWKIDRELAEHYVVRYFRKYYPSQLSKHQKRKARAN